MTWNWNRRKTKSNLDEKATGAVVNNYGTINCIKWDLRGSTFHLDCVDAAAPAPDIYAPFLSPPLPSSSLHLLTTIILRSHESNAVCLANLIRSGASCRV